MRRSSRCRTEESASRSRIRRGYSRASSAHPTWKSAPVPDWAWRSPRSPSNFTAGKSASRARRAPVPDLRSSFLCGARRPRGWPEGSPVMKKVLIIEDETSIRNNIMLMLKVEGYATSGGENGRVGLEMAQRDPPDLVLCDVMMPEMDGFAVLEALRADPRLSAVPFIFLTALDDRQSMRRGMNLGADDYLPKPFTRDELMEAVNSRLKKYEILTQTLTAMVPKQDQLTQKFRDKISGGDGATSLPGPDAANLTGKIAVATVLFADIRNFTTYSERLTSDEAAKLLNATLESASTPLTA